MKVFIYNATKRELYGHEWNFRDVYDVIAVQPTLMSSKAGTPFDQCSTVQVKYDDGTSILMTAEDLGDEETYWIKLWPSNRWIRLTADDTPSAAHLHPM